MLLVWRPVFGWFGVQILVVEDLYVILYRLIGMMMLIPVLPFPFNPPEFLTGVACRVLGMYLKTGQQSMLQMHVLIEKVTVTS